MSTFTDWITCAWELVGGFNWVTISLRYNISLKTCIRIGGASLIDPSWIKLCHLCFLN